jgi:hypothetical protein
MAKRAEMTSQTYGLSSHVCDANRFGSSAGGRHARLDGRLGSCDSNDAKEGASWQ